MSFLYNDDIFQLLLFNVFVNYRSDSTEYM